MFSQFKYQMNRKRLQDENYSFLFDEPPGDEYVCFDCETTGINPRRAEILSIGAVIIRNNHILTSRKLELFVKPSKDINEASIKVHHLRHCDLKDGLDPKHAVLQFLRFIGSRPLVGYYLEFDVAMINKYLRPLLGIVLPNEQTDVSGIYYEKKVNALHQTHIDLRFDVIMEELDLPSLGQHDAFNDALMTAMMYVKLQNIKKL
ncbi:3'-5' exonuclease [Candidatus Albibeggiatoa sp. nov. BB20]|uniref:3'-5' exonuclease n=1 Tax=Candidatus Albibeggiatoa sp. nov. BB20 TaxID=3162723 RepID=UPI0033654D38